MERCNFLSSIGYWLFHTYVYFIHNVLFYRKTYVVGAENVPHRGTALMIVSNHQNCLNDALCISCSLPWRKVHFIVRADVFKNPIANKFLRFIGLMPAFRLNYEGEEQLGNNKQTFEEAGKILVDGNMVVIYPEAGHQDKRWLGDFSLGYLKLAFEAAQRDNFSKEIYVMPSCNHYSNYFGMRHDEMVMYSKPIALSPYYELFKEKPRTAQRVVNEIVRKEIKSMMLNVEDIENYDAIDYIRSSSYGEKCAKNLGLNPDILTEKLQSDKTFVAQMAMFKERNEALFKKVCENVLEMKKSTLEHGFRDWNFEKQFSWSEVLLKIFVAILFVPLFLLQIPNLIIYLFPKIIIKRLNDKMFINSINLGSGILFTIPIVSVLSFVLAYVITKNILLALLYLLLLPFLGVVSFSVYKSIVKVVGEFRFRRFAKTVAGGALINLRQTIFSVLDKELKI